LAFRSGGEPDSPCSLLKTIQLLGVHVMDEQATELIHIGLMAMQNGSPLFTFSETCFHVPTLSALYKTAALDAIWKLADSELGVTSLLLRSSAGSCSYK